MIAPVAVSGTASEPSRLPTHRRAGWVVAGVVSLAMLAPTARRGFVLRLDMVFVPNPAINARSLGLDGSVPRAVPMDFLVAVASRGIPAEAVQKILLFAIPLLGVLGTWRLLQGVGLVGQLGGSLAFSWNAYVYERLVLGHWSLLLGVATLPWVLAAAMDVRKRVPRSQHRLLLWLGVACVATPTSGLLAIVVATGVLTLPGATWSWSDVRRGIATTCGVGVLFTAIWWVPGLLALTRGPADPAGVAAFAARADTPLGSVGSLLTFGGIWDAAAVPAGRNTWPVAVGAIAMIAVAIAGLVPAVDRWGRPVVAGLAAVAVLAAATAVAATASSGSVLLGRLVSDSPAFGLLRDGQKLLAPWLLLVSLCFGLGVARLSRVRLREASMSGIAFLVALLPVALLPGLAWGASARLVPVSYPADYVVVQTLLAGSAQPGDVLVLPWHLYQSWSWNRRTAVLDPMPRLLGRTVVVRDDLELEGLVVAGEDPRVPVVTEAIDRGGPLLPTLRRLGIGLVVVDLDTAGGPVSPTLLQGLPAMYLGRTLGVYQVPDPAASGSPHGVPIIVLVDLAAAALWAFSAVSISLPQGRTLLQFSQRRKGSAP